LQLFPVISTVKIKPTTFTTVHHVYGTSGSPFGETS
jgi:hypothetical protein